MGEQLNEKVSVITVYDRETGSILPKRIKWHNREYTITKLGYHHTVRFGRALMHIFHVTDGSTAFRLRLDTETLHWILEEVYDELADQ
jgi:hypothetical protein